MGELGLDFPSWIETAPAVSASREVPPISTDVKEGFR